MSLKSKIILGIIGLALVLRLIGINYGLPYFFVGDEQSQLAAGLVMLKTQNLVPAAAPADFKLLYYPAVMSYFYLLFVAPVLAGLMLIKGLNPGQLADAVALDPTIPWLAGRILIVILGTLSVYLVYILAKRLFDEKIGALAAFFLATSFLFVSLSHFTRHWVPTIFFEILTMLAAVNIWKRGQRRDYVWAAVFSSLSFGVGFIGILSAFFPVAAHFSRTRMKGFADKNFWLFAILLVLIVGAIIGLYPQRFLDISQGTDVSIFEDKSFAGFWASWVFHLKTLLFADPVILVLALGGLILGLMKARGLTLIFSVYFALYISSLYFVIHDEPRYISFVYPGLVMLAALPAGVFFQKLRARAFARIVSALILIIMLGYPILISGKYSWLLAQKDTRVAARDWIQANLPQSAKIFSFSKPEVLTPSKEAIKFQEMLAPKSLRTQDRALLALPDENYPGSYFVLSWPKLESENLDFSVVPDNFIPEYAVLQYWNLDGYIKIPSQYKGGVNLINFSPGLEEPQDFTNNFDAPAFLLLKMRRLGPLVEVHKL